MKKPAKGFARKSTTKKMPKGMHMMPDGKPMMGSKKPNVRMKRTY